MDSPRSINSPQTPSKSITRNFISLQKIDFPDDEPKRIRLPKTMKQLLSIATDVLELARPAKQIFDTNHNKITDISNIQPNSILLVSCCSPPVKEEDKPKYKTRVPKPKAETPIVHQQQSKPIHEDAIEHQMIASSPYTVRENMRNSLLSLYDSLTIDQKSKLSFSDSLQQLSNQTKQHLLEDDLISKHISPTSVLTGTDIHNQVVQYFLNLTKGLSPKDYKFVITGPTKSGKSTLLYTSVTLFHQRLLLSNLTKRYLIVSINWEMEQLYFDDIRNIYKMFIGNTINSLKNEYFNFSNSFDSLLQWFQSLLIIPGFPSLPSSVLKQENFPKNSILEIGRTFHETWNDKKGLKDFLEHVIRFPINMSNAFGYESAVYVFDHFDCAEFTIVKTEHFPKYKKQIKFTEMIYNIMKNVPFFVASKDDTEFYNVFEILENFKQLMTERLITVEDEKEIVVNESDFSININMCNGCPAYCVMFQKILDKINELNEKCVIKSKFSGFRSLIDEERNQIVKNEFLRLCLLLENINDDLDKEKIAQLEETKNVSFKIY